MGVIIIVTYKIINMQPQSLNATKNQ